MKLALTLAALLVAGSAWADTLKVWEHSLPPEAISLDERPIPPMPGLPIKHGSWEKPDEQNSLSVLFGFGHGPQNPVPASAPGPAPTLKQWSMRKRCWPNCPE